LDKTLYNDVGGWSKTEGLGWFCGGFDELIWKEPRRRPSLQRMDLPTACAIICVMPTADESNTQLLVPYATSTLHRHTMTAYTALA